jgi:hypothetical protein
VLHDELCVLQGRKYLHTNMLRYFNYIFRVTMVDPRKLKFLDEISLQSRRTLS